MELQKTSALTVHLSDKYEKKLKKERLILQQLRSRSEACYQLERCAVVARSRVQWLVHGEQCVLAVQVRRMHVASLQAFGSITQNILLVD